MSRGRGRRLLARYGAPLAFLAAATTAVLLVRAGLGGSDAVEPVTTRSARTQLVSRAPARPAKPVRKRFYVIRAGDTLDAMARRFDTSVERLLLLNPGVQPTSLRIGQRIRTA
jgi:peptidoglycan DL-endopeptidase LytF